MTANVAMWLARGVHERKESWKSWFFFDKGGQWRLALGTNGGSPETWARVFLFAQRLRAHKGCGKLEKMGEICGKPMEREADVWGAMCPVAGADLPLVFISFSYEFCSCLPMHC